MPNSITLTDAGIRGLPAPATGTQTYWDTTERGLGVRVSPKGTKTFIVLVGSGSRHKLGRFPLIGLAKAREEARKVLAKKTLGTFEKPNVITWESAVEKYLKACEDKNRPKTIYEYKAHLARFPFGTRRLTTIKKRDVSAELEKITAPSMRAHVLTSAKAFFSWCANEGYIDASPISALKTVAKKGNKAKRVLSQDELKEIFQTALKHPYPFGPLMALLVLHGQRRNETVTYAWERITAETITIPAEIAKNGLEHIFPYGPLTRQVFDGLPPLQSQYLFPASRERVKGKPSTVFNGWSKAKKAFDKKLKNVGPYKLHDLRRTFATTLQSIGVPLEVREKLLNHVSGTRAGVAGVYNQYGYDQEMRDAIAKYEAFLVNLIRSGAT